MELQVHPYSVLLLLLLLPIMVISHDYSEALSKSILFFEGQRSGYLPNDQRLTWRRHSGLSDGWTHNIDLTGGYYDAGDNVKFHFPMAFTTTMLAWSVIEFGNLMPPSELRNALVAVRWGSNYLLKSVSQLPYRIFVQVGDPIADHNCWERPEDMDTPRTAYAVNAPNPASEVAGEIAAALAAASIAFRSSDPGYSQTLIQNAVKTFQFADTYRGPYSDNADIRDDVCPFYCDFNGYQDELLWGAAWLRRATGDDSFLKYVESNREPFGASENVDEFGWDNKIGGLNVLVSKEVVEGNMYSLAAYKASADSFMCSLVPESPGPHVEYTPGGLLYKPGGSQLQHATTISFLILVYANYLSRTSQSLSCAMAEEVNSTENALSPEDLAWVDSCLTTVPEDSDSNNWGSLREILTEIIDNHQEMLVQSSTRSTFGFNDEDMGETESNNNPSLEGEAYSENNSNSSLTEEVNEILSLLSFESDPSKHSLQDYNLTTTLDPVDDLDDDPRENGEMAAESESPLSILVKDDLMGMSIQDIINDPFDDFNVYEDQIKVTTPDIFQVWDLEIPSDENEEDDEFGQQLKKAINDSFKERIRSQANHNGNIDDLIAGISDLSLSESFK